MFLIGALFLGNKSYYSVVMKTGELNIIFTAPYGKGIDRTGSFEPHPGFTHETIIDFVSSMFISFLFISSS
jgi:hypothetical protein